MRRTIISEKRVKEHQEETSDNKANELLTRFQRDNQSKEEKLKRYSRDKTLHSYAVLK